MPPELEILRDPGREMEDRILQLALVQSLLSSSDGTMWKQAVQRWIKAEGASDQELKEFNQVYDTVESTIRTGIQDPPVQRYRRSRS